MPVPLRKNACPDVPDTEKKALEFISKGGDADVLMKSLWRFSLSSDRLRLLLGAVKANRLDMVNAIIPKLPKKARDNIAPHVRSACDLKRKDILQALLKIEPESGVIFSGLAHTLDLGQTMTQSLYDAALILVAHAEKRNLWLSHVHELVRSAAGHGRVDLAKRILNIMYPEKSRDRGNAHTRMVYIERALEEAARYKRTDAFRELLAMHPRVDSYLCLLDDERKRTGGPVIPKLYENMVAVAVEEKALLQSAMEGLYNSQPKSKAPRM